MYALLQLSTFICIIAINQFCEHLCSWQCLNALFSFHFSVWPIGNGIVGMHYAHFPINSYCIDLLILTTFEYTIKMFLWTIVNDIYHNLNLLYIILQLISFVFTIVNNHSFHMYYSNWKIVHELLQVTTFVCTIAIYNFLCTVRSNNFCIFCCI